VDWKDWIALKVDEKFGVNGMGDKSQNDHLKDGEMDEDVDHMEPESKEKGMRD
jgi:hypothetical protein